MKITIESEYGIGDEILYEAIVKCEGNFVQAYLKGVIKSVIISCPNKDRNYTLEYELENGKKLKMNEITGHVKVPVSIY